MKLSFWKFFAPLLFVAAFFVFVPSVKAITISPVLVDLSMDPGTAKQGSIKLLNDSSEKQIYYASVQNFVPLGEEGQQAYLPESDRSGLATWIKLDAEKIEVPAGGSADFAWTVDLPKDAEPGGHYAAVFFSLIPPSEKETGVGVSARVGELFLVNVSGDVKEALRVESFQLMSHGKAASQVPTSFITRLPANFDIRIRNDGSVHLSPGGKIIIRNILGNQVGSVALNPLESRVLPNSVRKVRAWWGSTDDVSSDFLSELKAEWKGFGIGKYTATIDASYGKQHQAITADVSFWMFPWHLAIIALLILIVLILVLKGYNRIVVRSAMSKMDKSA